MKKLSVILVLCVLVTSAVSAQVFAGWWTAGDVAFNFYSGDETGQCLNMSFDVPEFNLMHRDSGLTVTLSPFHYDTFGEKYESVRKRTELKSFVNLKLSLDFLKDDREWAVTPYALINWNPFAKDNSSIRAEAGLAATWWFEGELGSSYPFRVKVFTANFGYGIRRNEPYFTAGLSFDLATITFILLDAEIEKAENDGRHR